MHLILEGNPAGCSIGGAGAAFSVAGSIVSQTIDHGRRLMPLSGKRAG
jgi:hypothetical protein